MELRPLGGAASSAALMGASASQLTRTASNASRKGAKHAAAAGNDDDEDDDDRFKPQQSHFLALWVRQLGVMLRNNFTLSVLARTRRTPAHPHTHPSLSSPAPAIRGALSAAVPPQFLRYYRSTLLQIIAPFFFMLFLFILQQAAKSADVVPNAHPDQYPRAGVAPCKVLNAHTASSRRPVAPCPPPPFSRGSPQHRSVRSAAPGAPPPRGGPDRATAWTRCASTSCLRRRRTRWPWA